MALSTEEISEIAETVAKKIIGKALCKCAFTTWHRRLDFDAIRMAIEKRDWKWIEDAIPHVDEAIRDMESDCKIDLSDAKVSLADVKSYTKERNFLEVSLAMYGVRGKISNKLYECSQVEQALKESNPGKEPWQMTKAEFDNKIFPTPEIGARYDLLTGQEVVITDRETVGLGAVWTISDAKTGRKIGDITTPVLNKAVLGGERATTHRGLINKALLEGKPVPPEVLADYPDLRTRESNLSNPNSEKLAALREILSTKTVEEAIVARGKYRHLALTPDELEVIDRHLSKLESGSNPDKTETTEYPYHGVAYGFEGQVLETDDFQYLPSLDSLRQWAIVIAKGIYGEQGGYGPGLKMPIDKIVITGPSGLSEKWSRWDLFR